MLLLTKKYSPYFLFILSSFFMLSCVKDVDFDQAETLKIEPVVDVSLLYFDLQASQVGFIPNNDVNPYSVQDTTKLEIFSKPFLEENLKEATFDFEFLNSIPRIFNAKIVLYDNAYNVLDEIEILVNMPKVTTTVPYNDSEIQKIKNMAYMGIELMLMPGTPMLDPNSSGELLLKSSGTFFMSIDAD